LPSRFRRTRVLIVGCGDVGLRVARALPARVRVLALTSTPGRGPQLRARGITPLAGNLDQPRTLARLAGLAHHVLHLAPPSSEPQDQWWRDRRTHALLRSLRLRSVPSTLVYASTSGVYGDCGGARVGEARPQSP
jgi:nucleoside-diphosphate-sugar epimerase